MQIFRNRLKNRIIEFNNILVKNKKLIKLDLTIGYILVNVFIMFRDNSSTINLITCSRSI